MKTTRQYKNSTFANDLSDLSNLEMSPFVELPNMLSSSEFRGTQLHDYKNVIGNENLDNEMSNASGQKLTGAEVQAIWKESGTTMTLQEWLKTTDAKEDLAYALQKKDNPASLSNKELKKLYKDSKSKLSMDEWSRTDAAKGAIRAKLHERSGSKQSFGDWLKTDNAQSLLTNATLLTALVVTGANQNLGTAQSNLPPANYTTRDTINQNQNTDKGMNVITKVALVGGVLTLAFFGVRHYINKKG